MNPMHFSTIVDGGAVNVNYRLRREPVSLKLVVVPVLETPDGGTWENEGGALAPPPYEVTTEERFRPKIRMHPGRKQGAARMVVPRESIKVVQINQPVAPAVAIAELTGKTPQDVQIELLEGKIKELLGLVQSKGLK